MPLTGPSAGATILEAIQVLSYNFTSTSMQPPATLTLAHAEQGQQMMLAVRAVLGRAVRLPDDAVLPTVDPDGSVWIEMQVRGIVVRWPATKTMAADGRAIWE